MKWCLGSVSWVVAPVLGAVLAPGAWGQSKALTDAEVEANVLRALASAPELSAQDIRSTTVYGVVTLSGSARDEASRTKAENLVARADGVKKVVDELTIGAAAYGEPNAPPNPDPAAQADKPYAPTSQTGSQAMDEDPAARNQAPADQQATSAPPPQNPSVEQPPTSNRYPGRAPQYDAGYPPPPASSSPYEAPPPVQQQADNRYGYDGEVAPEAGQPPSGRQQPYGGQYPPYPRHRPAYSQPYAVQGGQEAGRMVTIPGGALIRIRINQGLSTNRAQPGASFDGTVLNDVIADGAVAIPRGASVQGTVVDAASAGALKGRGELSLQLTRLNLGGQSYAISSDLWSRNGSDKTVRTVNSALGLGAVGAIIGGVAGGGAGAAIGAGVGGAAGVASSAASAGGQVIVPPEAILTFHIAQPVTVSTVSESEMMRLAYAAGPARAERPQLQPRPYGYPYPYPYYGPYGPYPYYRRY